MTRTKSKNFDSIAILIIAVSALVVSIWQVNLTRAHNRLTVRPYLDIDFKFESAAILTIKNKGEGAAVVDSFHLEMNGQKFSDWKALFANMGDDITPPISRTFDDKDIIGASEELILCSLPLNVPKKVQIVIVIDYKSIYDEPFQFRNNFSWGG